MLSAETINKIAAGEVIVRPVSVVKELVENSIDAGAKKIAVTLEAGGKQSITVRDDGCGIAYKEVPLAFKRHATSKLSRLEDLEVLTSLGFRGEALSSVSAVSKVTITSKSLDEEMGSISEFEEGRLIDQRVCAYSGGTEIRIGDLFYNTPARRKHLARDQKEELLIKDLLNKLALSHPQIDFSLISRGKTIMDTTGAGSLLQVISLLYGENLSQNLIELEYENQPMLLKGFIGNLQTTRASREDQIFFINQRFIKSRALADAFEEAYSGYLMKNTHPLGIIFLDLPSRMLDVNIHPAKTEIKILNQSLIQILFRQGIREHLKKANLVVDIAEVVKAEQEEKPDFQPQVIQDSFIKKKEKLADEDISQSATDKRSTQPTSSASLTIPGEETQNSLYAKALKDKHIIEDSIIAKKDLVLPEIKIEDKAIPQAGCSNQIMEERINYQKSGQVQDSSDFIGQKPVSKNRLPRPDFLKMKLIGQLFDIYILLQSQDQVYLIDQHAAHEAFLTQEFESIFAGDHAIPSQQLLSPLTLKFRPKDKKAVVENLGLFKQMGFETEIFGEACLLVRSVPIILGETLELSFLEDFIAEYSGTGFAAWEDKNPLAEPIKNRLITMACKAAIKGGQALSESEIKVLLERLMELDNPFTCPHGRPIILRLKEYELMKLFKRVV
ncbi:DNA mismatch repair endonuclease MutL [Eubacteriaceae bacterium ES3]|nr:DNA mismatch repair endonuclease MutL [Eubacteriaceae bacterium ES3]